MSYNDSLEEDMILKRKKLIFQSNHRGCKETDFLLGDFAKRYVGNFDANQLEQFSNFINENDIDIYSWLTGSSPLPAKHDNEVIKMLYSWIKNDNHSKG